MNGWRVTALACVFAAASVVAAQAQLDTARALERAGFTMAAADTPPKLKALKAMPAGKFVARKNGTTPYYIYPDPGDCQCAFVGNQQAMARYAEMMAIPKAPPGYETPTYEDDTQASGVNPMGDVVNDMDDDLDSVDDDAYFVAVQF